MLAIQVLGTAEEALRRQFAAFKETLVKKIQDKDASFQQSLSENS